MLRNHLVDIDQESGLLDALVVVVVLGRLSNAGLSLYRNLKGFFFEKLERDRDCVLVVEECEPKFLVFMAGPETCRNIPRQQSTDCAAQVPDIFLSGERLGDLVEDKRS